MTETETPPKKKKRDRGSKQFIIVIWIVLAVLIVIIFFSLRILKKHRDPIKATGQVTSVQVPRDIQGGYTGKASPKFNKALIKKGEIEGEKALQEGKSYVAPLTNSLDNSPEKKNNLLLKKVERYKKNRLPEPEVEPAKAPSTAKPPAVPKRKVSAGRSSQPTEKKIEEIRRSIKAQLAEISKKMVYPGHQAKVFESIELETKSDPSDQIQDTESSSGKEKFNMVKALGIRPGDVFYAANKETLNTDTPAPVATVELLSGPLKHSIAQGTFKLQGDLIAFTFNLLTDPNGEKFKMTGFAVDPSTKFAGVASDVDHHYLSRWGGLIASSFFKGWAEAVESSGASSSANLTGGLVVEENPEYSLKDKFWIASGEVASALGDSAKANFNRAVTAYLNSQDPIGVLIIDLEPI